MKNKFAFINKKLAAASAAVSGVVLAGAAQAQSVLPIDFNMADTNTDIITVGGAMIGLAVTAVGIKWVKATFFG
ncbi:hypothetical protein [Cellvibrio sp. PSBB006]|uniref:hypothetical protein n=1 Tax=Cellvibrio sp. PSBB006 TaxID=1987723 RepID=UPI000B3B2069|nr:hypothetical protein [Cellvibrio sp. PSBB006]ARU27783.1 hypothetical protein CBR65_10280 [Cellvibrio sp. PSBB006]